MTGRDRSRRWGLPRTLRTRITAVAALAVVTVLSVAGAGLVLAQRTALVQALDENLDQQADVLADRLRADRPLSDRDLPSDDFLVEVVGPGGRVLLASPDLEGRLPELPAPGSGSTVATVDLPGSEQQGRLLVREVRGVTIRIAGDLDDVRDSVAALAAGLLVGVPLSAALLAVIVWWAVGRTLRPVEAIRARVDEISAARLDQRVPEPATGDEIARLARTMNAMLARLQDSADRQRRFVSDASHELRSPLARMRAELEVDQAHPGSADPAGTAASVLAETVGLQRLVDDLLLLARGDEGVAAPAETTLVDLDELVDGVVRRLRADGGVRVDTRGVHPVQVSGSRGELERAVTNLLENALRHARRQVTVTVRETPDGRAEVIVADDGPGIPAEQRDRIFERFTRLDDARTAGAGGAGLGLAIARDIATRHGGTLTLAPVDPGARFVLSLPVPSIARTDESAVQGRGRAAATESPI